MLKSHVPMPKFERWIPTRVVDRTRLIIEPIPFAPAGIGNWISSPELIDMHTQREEWIAVRLWVSDVVLQDCIVVNSSIRGGIPVVAGTRMTVSQVLGEVADGRSLFEVSEAFDLDLELLQKLFEGMAIKFDRPFSE